MDKKLLNEEIQNMKFLFGYKPGRVISEQDGMWTQTTTMDRLDEPMDEPMDDEGSMKSILKKHNLLDDVTHKGNGAIMMTDKSSEEVQRLLHILPSLTELQILAIVDCEFADFSDVDVCSLPKLVFVNLKGTENNFEEQGYECIDEKFGDMYNLK